MPRSMGAGRWLYGAFWIEVFPQAIGVALELHVRCAVLLKKCVNELVDDHISLFDFTLQREELVLYVQPILRARKPHGVVG